MKIVATLVVLLLVSIGVYAAYPENPNFNYLTVHVSEKNTFYNFTSKNQTAYVVINISATGNAYPFILNIFGQSGSLQPYGIGLFFISNYTGNVSLLKAHSLLSTIQNMDAYSAYLSNKFHHNVIAIPSFYDPSIIRLSSNDSGITIILKIEGNINSGIYGILLNNIVVISSHKSIIKTVYANQIIVLQTLSHSS